MGMIVNYPVESIGMKDIFKQLSIDDRGLGRELPVHFGGPVEANRGFILHSSEYPSGQNLINRDGIAVTANIAMLQELAQGQGPQQGMLVLGYAGWAPRQLESEIENGGWIAVPASKQLVFDTDNPLKWNLAVSSLGFDMGHFSTVVGHA